MEFILLIVLIFSIVSMHSLSARVAKLEKRFEATPVEPMVQGTVIEEMPANKLYESFPSEVVKDTQGITDEEVGGRLLGKIGIFAVLVGVSFFIKYAFDSNWVGPVGRVLVGTSIGVLALVLGKLMRSKYQNYSDVLMGGGLGVLYLSVYSGFFFYNLYNSTVAYVLLMVITAVSVLLSITNKTKVLAIVGLVCGFLVPVLVSVYTPTYVELLTYLLILDIGVVMVSYVYKWIQLNHIAFVGTMAAFIVAAGQHVDQISLGYKLTSATFYSYAFVYFLIFLASSIAHHVIRKELSNQDDIVFVALNGLSHGVIGYMLLYPIYPSLVGYFMLFLAIIYSIVSYVSFKTQREDAVLNKFLVGMAALFLTAAIPLHFDGVWISIFWFVQAIVFYAVDRELRGQNLYNYGAVVYLFGLVQVLVVASTNKDRVDVFFNQTFGLYLLAIATAYVLAWLLQRDAQDGDTDIVSLQAFYIGLAQFLTIISITTEISRYYKTTSGYASGERNTVISLFWMIYAVLLIMVGFIKQIRFLRLFGLVFFVITAIKLFVDVFTLGPLYAIVASITLGVLALFASFAYAKYSEKLKKLL